MSWTKIIPGFLITAWALILVGGANAKLPDTGFPPVARPQAEVPYRIVDTGQTTCYDNYKAIPFPKPEQPFWGQDAQYQGHQPAYKDNGDGTVTDLNTGLMWVKARSSRVDWEDALSGAAACRVGGYSDWRMPTIKELYSLINFTGSFRGWAANSTPYLDTTYFEFAYGNESAGERGIDCQDWSRTAYGAPGFHHDDLVFGVNFADGRIKGYPRFDPRTRDRRHKLYVRYVRGNPNYGKNDFHDNGNGTITDRATGLTWSKDDSGRGMNWQEALAWVQTKNRENFLGHNDWRLPNAKELQSIVDYTRAPRAFNTAQQGPALAPIFQTSRLSDGEYPFFWTSTTHLAGPMNGRRVSQAVYVTFGRALGYMPTPPFSRNYQLLDVHGAGAQRSDPKSGDPAAFPYGHGPQGDVIRIYNYVRLVRGGEAQLLTASPVAYRSSTGMNATSAGSLNGGGWLPPGELDSQAVQAGPGRYQGPGSMPGGGGAGPIMGPPPRYNPQTETTITGQVEEVRNLPPPIRPERISGTQSGGQRETGEAGAGPWDPRTAYGNRRPGTRGQQGPGPDSRGPRLVMLKTDQGRVTVILGPAWFVTEAKLSLKAGDKMEVTGAKVSRNGQDLIIAKEVKANGKTLKLLDENGRPVWIGLRGLPPSKNPPVR
jgi:hypothetical protein